MAKPQSDVAMPRPPADDQVDGDLAECIKAFNALIPGGAHAASMLRVWSLVGEHEEFAKVCSATASMKQNLVRRASLDDNAANEFKAQGNSLYQDRQFNAAIAAYARGLMCAATMPVVSVLLNNRAAVHLEQGLPLIALLDAHLAIQADSSNEKAVARRQKCLALLGHADANCDAADAAVRDLVSASLREDAVDAIKKAMIPTLNDAERSTLVDPAVFSVRESGASEPHVVAAVAGEAKTTVMVDTPFVSAVRFEGLLSSCAWCHRQTSCLHPSTKAIAAGRKTRGLYCGEACADAAWQHVSEAESTNVFWLACPVDALLAYRLVRRLKFDRTTADQRRRTESLREWTKELNSGATVGGHETAIACAAVAFGAIDSMDADDFRLQLRRLIANSQTIAFVDRVGDPKAATHAYVRVALAKALYLGASLFKHSCVPNAFVTYCGNPHRSSSEMHIRLIRQVVPGEEICVALGDISKYTNHSTRARIRDLRARFGFPCTCGACYNEVDEPIAQGEQEHFVKAADYYQKGRRLLRERDFASAVAVLSQSLEMVMRHVCPPPKPPQFVICKTHDALAQAFLALGNEAKCVEHIRHNITVMEQLQGANHLDLASEYRKLASLCARSTAPELLSEAPRAARRAIEVLLLHYAPSRALLAEVELLAPPHVTV